MGKKGKHSQAVRASTKVDVLVAALIIAVSAGVLLPALSRHREKSRRTLCADNLGHIAGAAALYAGDNDGLFPPTCPGNFATNRLGAPGGSRFGLGRLLDGGYAEKPGVFGCPGSGYARPAALKREWSETGLMRSAYLYRAGSGSGPPAAGDAGAALLIDFNLASYGKFNHGGGFVNAAFADCSVAGFCNRSGELTLPLDGPFYSDGAFRQADRLRSEGGE